LVIILSRRQRGGGGGGGGGSFGGFGKVPAKKKNIDQELFQEGQAILTGKAEIKEEMSSRFTFLDQERKLKSSQKKMTKAAAANANKIDVEKLAGKLTSEQFKALNYYIDVRYLNPKDYSQKGKGKGKKKKK